MLPVAADKDIFDAVKRIERPIVTLCGWCPDSRERTAAIIAAGGAPSHGLCPTCAAKLERELDARS